MRTARPAGLALVGLALLMGRADSALASAFNVSPTRIVLNAKRPSELLTLTNSSDRTIRFQLTLTLWDQSKDGTMKTAPTTDVVVYPPLVTIGPRESKRIRVGAQVPAADVERTYRLFVEELPDESGTADAARAVQVRTRMGIPIFLQGAKPVASVRLVSSAVRDSVFEFTVGNTGTTHAIIETLNVRGLNASGTEVFGKTANGWYLLAQHEQAFRVPLDGAECTAIDRLELVVTTTAGVVRGRTTMAAGLCGAR